MLELIKVKINHSPRVNAVATIFDRRTKYSQTMLEEIKALFKDQMLETVIRLNVALKKAASKGVSVIEFERKSNGAVDHLALAEEIVRSGVKEIEAREKAEEVEKAIMALTDTAAQPQESLMDGALDSSAPSLIESVGSLSREIRFAIDAPNAKDIYIVGDFNHWKMDEGSRLSRRSDGKWEKSLGLSTGRYKYKFVIDGQWVLDSQNSERVPNAFGTFDSIINL
jgi:hypothetical protein